MQLPNGWMLTLENPVPVNWRMTSDGKLEFKSPRAAWKVYGCDWRKR